MIHPLAHADKTSVVNSLPILMFPGRTRHEARMHGGPAQTDRDCAAEARTLGIAGFGPPDKMPPAGAGPAARWSLACHITAPDPGTGGINLGGDCLCVELHRDPCGPSRRWR